MKKEFSILWASLGFSMLLTSINELLPYIVDKTQQIGILFIFTLFGAVIFTHFYLLKKNK